MMASAGIANPDIAREVGVSRPTVQLWRERLLALRVAGLEQDAPRPGRLPSIPAQNVRADNDATHTHPRVQAWLTRHPRFHLHVIPTSSSWVNMVERWCRDIIDKRVRRGVSTNVPEYLRLRFDEKTRGSTRSHSR